jgi:hypothetical protein
MLYLQSTWEIIYQFEFTISNSEIIKPAVKKCIESLKKFRYIERIPPNYLWNLLLLVAKKGLEDIRLYLNV